MASVPEPCEGSRHFIKNGCIGNYENVNISSFAVLGINLWLEEDGDLNRNYPLYSFTFIQSVERSNRYKMLSSFSYNFTSYKANLKNFCIFIISNNKSFISRNLKVLGTLGGKFDFLNPSGSEI